MHLQTSGENTSNLDRLIGFSLAAFSMFVVGYTATRAYLVQDSTSSPVSADADFVVPHEAALWSDLGN